MKTILIDLIDEVGRRAFVDRFANTLTNVTTIPFNKAVIGKTDIRIEFVRKDDDLHGAECLLDALAKMVSADASARLLEDPVVIICSGSCGMQLTVHEIIADAERYMINQIQEMGRHFNEGEHFVSEYLDTAGTQEWQPWCGKKTCDM